MVIWCLPRHQPTVHYTRRRLDVSDGVRQKILGGNAAALLNLR
jgi:predicted TIM-barrel fold metal-dependent hydrolase